MHKLQTWQISLILTLENCCPTKKLLFLPLVMANVVPACSHSAFRRGYCHLTHDGSISQTQVPAVIDCGHSDVSLSPSQRKLLAAEQLHRRGRQVERAAEPCCSPEQYCTTHALNALQLLLQLRVNSRVQYSTLWNFKFAHLRVH